MNTFYENTDFLTTFYRFFFNFKELIANIQLYIKKFIKSFMRKRVNFILLLL